MSAVPHLYKQNCSSNMRALFDWQLRSRTVRLGPRTLLMGIVNVTPDSFADGGQHFDPDAALSHAMRLLDDGADIIDIGGESTRPGTPTGKSATVSPEEEMRRVLPVLDAIRQHRPDAIISVDTYKSETARAAVEHGADIINDVSAGTWDDNMLPALGQLRCGVVLMHTRGRPDEWRKLPPVGDVVNMVMHDLGNVVQVAFASGIDRERIVLDPGFGFGKSFDENYPLLAHFEQLHRLGFPLLAGPSRKGFIGRILSRGGKDASASERLYGTLATITACILKGAHIVRVHDVAAARDAAAIADTIIAAA
jgi:dihydropteroate synthase